MDDKSENLAKLFNLIEFTVIKLFKKLTILNKVISCHFDKIREVISDLARGSILKVNFDH